MAAAPSPNETAPIENEVPGLELFREPDELSDVVLVVEDTKLHVHKSVLGLHSPVFKSMFVSDFKEKNAKEIALPGKKLETFVPFLQLMYPVHCLKPVDDDTMLETMALANEYDVQQIRLKFEHHIKDQVTLHANSLSTDQILTYLWLSQVYGFSAHCDRLLELVALISLKDLKQSSVYSSLPLSIEKDVVTKRCELLEQQVTALQAQVNRQNFLN